MIRIDDRLIHGQVALVWSKHLGVNRIVVANDQIAENDVQKSALKMAAPDSAKVSVVPVSKAVELVNDPRAEKLKILVVVNNPLDVKRLVEGIKEKPYLNMANFGRINGSLHDKRKVFDTVYLAKDDESALHSIFNLGFDLDYQPLPSDNKKSLKKMMGA
ncbi:PTS system mannose/fructose/N-acetylgalactosamine-transporter subunit IIB [Rossellomorea marisflavi]|uniref:PTS system mannose/fructose/N-acetylgalactosamine-transporter subunit IIB n=1 Tax=Rossellomorea marisflavi TaxID=189381 RepID=UPI003513C4EB